jgi:hypothetical protein
LDASGTVPEVPRWETLVALDMFSIGAIATTVGSPDDGALLVRQIASPT